jgi:hypothetical protein
MDIAKEDSALTAKLQDIAAIMQNSLLSDQERNDMISKIQEIMKTSQDDAPKKPQSSKKKKRKSKEKKTADHEKKDGSSKTEENEDASERRSSIKKKKKQRKSQETLSSQHLVQEDTSRRNFEEASPTPVVVPVEENDDGTGSPRFTSSPNTMSQRSLKGLAREVQLNRRRLGAEEKEATNLEEESPLPVVVPVEENDDGTGSLCSTSSPNTMSETYLKILEREMFLAQEGQINRHHLLGAEETEATDSEEGSPPLVVVPVNDDEDEPGSPCFTSSSNMSSQGSVTGLAPEGQITDSIGDTEEKESVPPTDGSGGRVGRGCCAIFCVLSSLALLLYHGDYESIVNRMTHQESTNSDDGNSVGDIEAGESVHTEEDGDDDDDDGGIFSLALLLYNGDYESIANRMSRQKWIKPDGGSSVGSTDEGEEEGGSRCGGCTGIFLFFSSFALLFYNEGMAVKRAKDLDEGAGIVEQVGLVTAKDSATIDTSRNNKLVYVTGELESGDTGPLYDPDFEWTPPALKYSRSVETYQWEETKKSEGEQEKCSSCTAGKNGCNKNGYRETGCNSAGYRTTKTYVYTYEQVWKTGLIDSTEFEEPQDPDNPTQLLLDPLQLEAEEVTLGAYSIDSDVFSKVDWYTDWTDPPLKPSVFNSNPKYAAYPPQELEGDGGVYFGYNAFMPEIGDTRVDFKIVLPGTVSVVALQTDDGLLKSYITSGGRELLLVGQGTKTSDQLFAQAEAENTATKWLLRSVGFLMMYSGVWLILSPIADMVDLIPLIGDCAEGILSSYVIPFLAFTISFPLTLLTISIALAFYNPLFCIGVVVFGALLFYVVRQTIKRKPANAAGAEETEATDFEDESPPPPIDVPVKEDEAAPGSPRFTSSLNMSKRSSAVRHLGAEEPKATDDSEEKSPPPPPAVVIPVEENDDGTGSPRVTASPNRSRRSLAVLTPEGQINHDRRGHIRHEKSCRW